MISSYHLGRVQATRGLDYIATLVLKVLCSCVAATLPEVQNAGKSSVRRLNSSSRRTSRTRPVSSSTFYTQWGILAFFEFGILFLALIPQIQEANAQSFTFSSVRPRYEPVISTSPSIVDACFFDEIGTNTSSGSTAYPNIKWSRNAGSSGTASDGTGPSGSFSGSTYMYLEASSPVTLGDTAAFTSCSLNFGSGNAYVSFYYHMYGANMGTFKVQAAVASSGTWQTVFIRTGNQTEFTSNNSPWQRVVLNLRDNLGGGARPKYPITPAANLTPYDVRLQFHHDLNESSFSASQNVPSTCVCALCLHPMYPMLGCTEHASALCCRERLQLRKRCGT